MDGRGRLLRSVKVGDMGFAPAALAYAGALRVPDRDSVRSKNYPPLRQPRRGLRRRILNRLAGPGTGICFSFVIFLIVGAYGIVKGGHYEAFVASEGHPAEVIAKALGFSIKAVTIAGESEIKEQDILAIAGVGPRNSLLFLDVAKIRERLKQLPLVKEAAITKLYPDRLLIEIEERQPFALWQSGGVVQIVAADGVPIAHMRDQRFIHLPLVVGAGANERLPQYLALLDAAGDLRERIVAGLLVARRHWTLKTTNGIDILLPETDPEGALARLLELQRASHVLDKDLLSVDLRQPGRMVARLSEEAAAERNETMAHKGKAKGGRT
ncbi:cell division protein FtsQ [Beijerinckiaceae bacterium]|nr:cell division protein FtsQ [Beijerinckiaceae bacterium]